MNTMTTLELILTIIQLVSGLAVTVIVLMQSGKSAGLSGAIAGGAETFLSKGKAKTLDAKLAKATKWFGLVFVVLTLVLTVLMHKGSLTVTSTEGQGSCFLAKIPLTYIAS
jgi:preprotein translocase subunit SecG